MGISREPLLKIQNLKTSIDVDDGTINPVNDVSFTVNKGEIVALVGESGSGKSVSSLSIVGLNDRVIKYDKESKIYFNNENLLEFNEEKMRKIRGKDIGMIFQDPKFSLNPVHTIGRQISELIILHQNKSKIEAKKDTLNIFKEVGLSDGERLYSYYPHQISGGMRQRVMIGMAIACNPSLLIADEPTTALDVTIQAQILSLLRQLQKGSGISILLITHDLGVVAEMADRVIVMYCGKIVEEGTVYDIFDNPMHPYTKGLMESVPPLHGPVKEQLDGIPGVVPNPLELPKGCNFVTRCEHATEKCKKLEPQMEQFKSGSKVACWNPLVISEVN